MKTVIIHVLLVFVMTVQCKPHLVKHVLEETDKTIKGISRVVTGGFLGGTSFNIQGQVSATSDVHPPTDEPARRPGIFGLGNLFHHHQKPHEKPGQGYQEGHGHHHHHGHIPKPPPYGGNGEGGSHGGDNNGGGNYGNNEYGGQGNKPSSMYGQHPGYEPPQQYNPNGPNPPHNHHHHGSHGSQGNSPYSPHPQHPGYHPNPENNQNGQPPCATENQYGNQVNNPGQHPSYQPPQENNQNGSPTYENQQGNNVNQQGSNGNQQGSYGHRPQSHYGGKETGPGTPEEAPKPGNNVALSPDQYVYGSDGIKVKEPGADQDVDDFSIDVRVASDKE